MQCCWFLIPSASGTTICQVFLLGVLPFLLFSLLQCGPPPLTLLGEQLQPPGIFQQWLMVIAARTGRVAAPLTHRGAGTHPEK